MRSVSPSALCLTYPASLRLLTLNVVRGGSFSDANLGPQWHLTEYSEVIGQGETDFRAAAYRLMSWRAHHSAGVGVTIEHVTAPASTSAVDSLDAAEATDQEIATVHFGPTSSPCLVLHRSITSTDAVMIYGTLPGHVESGEEAFAVHIDPQGLVTARCVAFSRHAWWAARLGSPVARRVQKMITRKYVRGMRPRARHQR